MLSALPPLATGERTFRIGSFVPGGDIATALLPLFLTAGVSSPTRAHAVKHPRAFPDPLRLLPSVALMAFKPRMRELRLSK